MASINDWINAANNIKKQTTDNYINKNQGIINSINQQRDAEMKGLENNNLQAINQLNQNKETVNKTALDNARAANVNRLLALKDNKNAMSRAGLSSQGLVGSQVNSINNNYGSNLNTILKDKASGLRDIENQINNTNLQYDTNKSNLAAQYASTLASQQANINNAATQLGLQAYNDYISQQQAYANYEAQRQEADRQNALAWAQLNASNNSRSFGDSGSDDYEFHTEYNNFNKSEDAYKFGTFSNGYQPKGISGHGTLKKTGATIKNKTRTLSGEIRTLEQNVWIAQDGTKWYWEGRENKYKRVG